MNLKLLGACSALSLLMFADADAMRAGRQQVKARHMGLAGVQEYNAVKRDAHARGLKTADYVASGRDSLGEDRISREALSKFYEERMADQEEKIAGRGEEVSGIEEEASEEKKEPASRTSNSNESEAATGVNSEEEVSEIEEASEEKKEPALRTPNPEEPEAETDLNPEEEVKEDAGEADAKASAAEFKAEDYKAKFESKPFAELREEYESLARKHAKLDKSVVSNALGRVLRTENTKRRLLLEEKIGVLNEIFSKFKVESLNEDQLLFEKARLENMGKRLSEKDKVRLKEIRVRLEKI